MDYYLPFDYRSLDDSNLHSLLEVLALCVDCIDDAKNSHTSYDDELPDTSSVLDPTFVGRSIADPVLSALRVAREEAERRGWDYPPAKREMIDERFTRRLDSFARLTLEIGGGWVGRTVHVLSCIDENSIELSVERFDAFGERQHGHVQLEMPQLLDRQSTLETLKKANFGAWSRCFDDDSCTDGEDWSVEIEFSDGSEPFTTSGYNQWPLEFLTLTHLVGASTDADPAKYDEDDDYEEDDEES